MVLTLNWREEIRERWGIHLLDRYCQLVRDILWVTRCSKIKSNVSCGIPKDLYVSSVNKYFYGFMEKQGLRYGVLSDKYGLHMDEESLSYYDVHPRILTSEDKRALGKLIRDKATCSGFSQIAFYNNSPLMSIPYFQMLHYSELPVFYTTSLNSCFRNSWGC